MPTCIHIQGHHSAVPSLPFLLRPSHYLKTHCRMFATSKDAVPPAITDQSIYLAFRNVFKDHVAEVRQLKPVKKFVQEAEKQPEVARLLSECEEKKFNRDHLYERIRVLLTAQVFKSPASAKLRFPDLPQPASQVAQSTRKGAPEVEASSSQPLSQVRATGGVSHLGDASDALGDSSE